VEGFHGVYAPNARLRSLVTPDDPVEEACAHESSEPPGSGGSTRMSGAEPIRKILRAMGYPADSPRVYPARSFEELYELDPAA
jgi:hypothetical protein